MVKDHSDSERGRKEMFYLTTHSTHFIYGYMVYFSFIFFYYYSFLVFIF